MNPALPICPYYLDNICVFGNHCKKAHPPPPPPPPPSAPPASSLPPAPIKVPSGGFGQAPFAAQLQEEESSRNSSSSSSAELSLGPTTAIHVQQEGGGRSNPPSFRQCASSTPLLEEEEGSPEKKEPEAVAAPSSVTSSLETTTSNSSSSPKAPSTNFSGLQDSSPPVQIHYLSPAVPDTPPPEEPSEGIFARNPLERDSRKNDKKSRMDMKRDARKAKKAARKRDKLARIRAQSERDHLDSKSNDDEEENLISVRETAEEMPSEKVPSIVSLPPPSPEETKNYEEPGITELTHLADSSPLLVRVLTKKEKKREERRLLIALKKKEKQERKMLEENEKVLEVISHAQNLFKEGNYVQSAIAFKKALENHSGNADLHAGCRDCYLALGKVYSALADAKAAVELRPSDPMLIKLLHLQIMSGKTDEAAETMNQIRDKASVSKEDHTVKLMSAKFAKASLHLEQEKLDSAVTILSDLEAICPHSTQWQIMYAECMFRRNQISRGQELLKKNLSQLREEKSYGYVKALERYFGTHWWCKTETEEAMLKQLEECKDLSERAKRSHERALLMVEHYKAGLQSLKISDKPYARKTLTAALLVDPQNCRYLSDLHALLSFVQDTNEDSLRQLDMSLRFHQTKRIYVERGKLLKSMRKYEEAIIDFENALRLEQSCQSTRRLLNQTRRCQSNSQRTSFRNMRSDLYSALNVTSNASPEEIGKAYHLRAQELHPDNNRDLSEEDRSRLETKMKSLTGAYKVLSDPRARASYDRQLKRNSSSDVDSECSEDEDFFGSDDGEFDEEDVDRRGLDESRTSASAARDGSDNAIQDLLQFLMSNVPREAGDSRPETDRGSPRVPSGGAIAKIKRPFKE